MKPMGGDGGVITSDSLAERVQKFSDFVQQDLLMVIIVMAIVIGVAWLISHLALNVWRTMRHVMPLIAIAFVVALILVVW